MPIGPRKPSWLPAPLKNTHPSLLDTESKLKVQLRVEVLEGDGAGELDLFWGLDSGFKVGLYRFGVAGGSAVVGGGRVDVPEIKSRQHLG